MSRITEYPRIHRLFHSVIIRTHPVRFLRSLDRWLTGVSCRPEFEILNQRRVTQHSLRRLPSCYLTDAALNSDQLLAHLEKLGLDVQTYHHPPLFTVEQSKQVRTKLSESIPGEHCKTLFLEDKKRQMWLLATLEDTSVDFKRLAELLDSARLSLGSSELLWKVLGVRPGSVSPFALINDPQHSVQVALERRMMDCQLLGYHPLTNDRTTTIRPCQLLTFIRWCGFAPRIIVTSTPDTTVATQLL